MASDDIAALGAWEDQPQRIPTADLAALRISSQQAFVWTRLDGVATISEICAMTGLGEQDTLGAIAALVAQGAATVSPAKGRRTPIRVATPDPTGSAEASLLDDSLNTSLDRSLDGSFDGSLGAVDGSLGSSFDASQSGERLPSVEQVEDLPPFHGVDPRDSVWLLNKGWLGYVPGMPWSRPGEGRFGRFKFDRRRLLERCDLTIAQRREIIFLTEAADDLDHFEYLNMEPSADKKDWRRAYFRFSKRFHPDTFFRREVGSFGDLAREIYTRATALHDAFSADDDLRAVYHRAITARNNAYRDALETARLAREAIKQQRAAEAEKVKRNSAMRKAIRRKAALRERIEQTTRARRERRVNPMQARIDRAARFYERGMKQYQEEKFLEAATSLQLAMNYDPKNETYGQAYERVSHKAKAVQAERIWKMGFMQESVARLDEAMELYSQAVDIQARPDFCIHLAELMVSMDHDLRRAAELTRKACDAQPENVDYLLLLARIYEKESLVKKATAALDRAARISPKDDRIKKAYKALKRL